MTTFKQLMNDGVLKRADSHKVRLQDIVVAEGFNPRVNGERLQNHIREVADFIKSGGQLPPLEVKPLDCGKVQVVDGHCRRAGYELALAEGYDELRSKDGEVWLAVVPFNGDRGAARARIATSNEGLKLTPLELAMNYKAMRDEDGLGPEEIAAMVGKTRQHVDQMLHLADAPDAVKQMVADGTVSATEAMKVARAHGENATEVLGQAAAKAAGKKVTAKALKPWTPPAKVTAMLVERVDEFMGTLTTAERTILAEIESGQSSGGTVMVSGSALLRLLQCHGTLKDERTKAEEKAREQAAKAAQADLADAA